MKLDKYFNFAIFSAAALFTEGCVNQPYYQVQAGYANTQHRNDLGGHIDLMCLRARGGTRADAKESSEQKFNPVGKEKFRLGADICYGKLPDSASKQSYSLEIPVVGEQETTIQGVTSSNLVKIAIPFLEYKYWGFEANFPGKALRKHPIHSNIEKDLSLSLWVSSGYAIDFTVSETDYSTSGGSLDNIPGLDVDGKFYGELTNEVTLFGKFPLGMSLRLDQDAKLTPSLLGGYKIQW